LAQGRKPWAEVSQHLRC